MRSSIFALFLASGVFAQTPSVWQGRQLMPSPFGKPAPRAATQPLVATPRVVGAPKMVLLKPESCTPPVPAMKRPEKFASAMPVVPGDVAVDPGIVAKVRVCEP